ncbi:hypothetical protein ACFY2K_42350 [Kitasatospora sp. NPDC001309]|uniref:hypothetical protein n=1 Tax=Kitasatospora sp. NPDC001309 TaxID=3364013 RepID=UPI003685D3D6
MSEQIIHKDPATGLPVGTVAAFLNLSAAMVALYADGTDQYGAPKASWFCLGCGRHSHIAQQLGTSRGEANAHAAECRAIPWPQAVLV